MSYFTVLGYENNSLLISYQKKYFQKLLRMFIRIPLWDDLQKQFLKVPIKSQLMFLLHPDISSLLHDISLTQSESSLTLLGEELGYFFEEKTEKSALFAWEKIADTEIYLTCQDNNPINNIVAHPDHDSSWMIGWWERSEQEWLEVYNATFALLKKVDIWFYHEINYLVKKIIPMKTSRGVHNSCSYKECVGSLYLWYMVDAEVPELNILEALIHESSHNKLNLIMQSEALHNNDFSLKYYSPYRPDARHIQGVLLWAHAIVPTVYVFLSAMEKGDIDHLFWKQKILSFHIKNKLALKVVEKYAHLTPIGQSILDDIKEVVSLCDKKIAKLSLTKQIDMSEIITKVENHFSQVKNDFPNLRY